MEAAGGGGGNTPPVSPTFKDILVEGWHLHMDLEQDLLVVVVVVGAGELGQPDGGGAGGNGITNPLLSPINSGNVAGGGGGGVDSHPGNR